MKTSTIFKTGLSLAAALTVASGAARAQTATSASASTSSPALQFLRSEISRENKQRIVYTDFGEGGTLYTQRAFLNADDKPQPRMNEQSPSPFGITCIHVTYPLAYASWNGVMFITGILKPGEQIPKLDFGNENCGFDLSGATALTFKAKGKTGKERLKFYMGGMGDSNSKYPDTDEITLTTSTFNDFVSLSSEWKDYTIDLKNAKLSRIANGFAWVTNKTLNQKLDTMEFDLDEIVYRFDKERHEPLFLRSYKKLPFYDKRSFVNSFAYTYDNALLAILMAKTGNIAYAKQVADAFVFCINHDRYYKPGPVRNAYANGSPVSHPGWKSPQNKSFAMLPGFFNNHKSTWLEDRYSVSLNTGVMAWVIEALLAVYDVTKTSDYLDAAMIVSDYIIANFSAADAVGGFVGGFEGWEGNTTKLTYKSTEHNIDLVSSFYHLYRSLQSSGRIMEKYLLAAKSARDFTIKMYDKGCFYTGTKGDGVTIDKSNRPLDTNTWAILTLTADNELCNEVKDKWDPETVYSFIWQTFKAGEGFDYNEDKDAIWHEGTAQLAVVAGRLSQLAVLASRLSKSKDYQRVIEYLNKAAEPNGSITSASQDNLTTGFDSLIVGEDGELKAIPWSYDHRVSLAATAWLALAQLQINPYYADK